jgi:hypothetical protein
MKLLLLTTICTANAANNTTVPMRKRSLSLNDVFYGICYNGIDAYPENMITEESYIEYIKCHPTKLFNLKPHIRTREFINKVINIKPEIFIHIPLYLRTLEQEYIYYKVLESKQFYDTIIVSVVAVTFVLFGYQELFGRK